MKNSMNKTGVIVRLVAIAAMVMYAHAEAQSQVHPDHGMGISPGVHAGAQAAASAGALATSNQIQNQIQNQAQITASSAAGGQGGTAYSTGNSQTMNVGTSHLRNNPNIGLGLMVPTAPCRDTYSVGGSAVGIGGGAAWSKADRECRWQDIGAAFIRAGFIEDGLAMWCAIEGVEDIAPTCRRLKAAKQPLPDNSETSENTSSIRGWPEW